jgi:hypothetical protein
VLSFLKYRLDLDRKSVPNINQPVDTIEDSYMADLSESEQEKERSGVEAAVEDVVSSMHCRSGNHFIKIAL